MFWQDAATFTKNSLDFADLTTSGPNEYEYTRSNIRAGTLSYDLGFATLQDNVSYYTEDSPGEYVIGVPGLGTLQIFNNDINRATTNEFRVVSKGQTAFEWVIGDFWRNSSFGRLESYAGYVNVPLQLTKINSASNSIYGEASYGFANDLVRVLVGARYFQDWRHFFTPSLAEDSRYLFQSFNPRFNVTLKPSEDFMVYLNIAKGFRSGFANPAAWIAAGGPKIVEPDSIWTYEVGSKVTLFHGNLYLDGDVFYSQWNNFQASATNEGIAFQLNGGNADIKGVEGTATWRTPIDGLSVNGHMSYDDGRFTKVSPNYPRGNSFVVGARLPAVPQVEGGGGLDYQVPLASTGLDFVGGGRFSYTGTTIDQEGVLGRFTDPRFELDLHAGIRKGLWEFAAFTNNATNNVNSYSSLGTEWLATRPRVVGVRVSGGF